MAPNPLLASEVQTLAEQLCFPMSAWVAELLYRLDDAALEAWAADQQSADSSPITAPTGVHIDDDDGIKAMFAGMSERRRQIKASGR